MRDRPSFVRLAATPVGLGLLALTLALGALRSRVSDVPLSPLTARGRVGADWPTRRGVTTGERPAGEMDDMAAYARDDFDPDAVHPEVRRFYERTGDYTMTFDVHWHRPFRLGAALAVPLTSRLEQLNLPGPRSEGEGPWTLDSEFLDVDPAADPREGARAWVRTDTETGEAVFVAVYGSTRGDGERHVNIAAPLAFSNLSTVLHLSHFDGSADGTGVELTTAAPGDPGLYLVTPLGAFELPMDQIFRVWPADAPDAPDAPETPAGTEETGAEEESPELVATHEMWLLGRQFLTVTYGAAETGKSQTSNSTS